jgi:hypothetical protein
MNKSPARFCTYKSTASLPDPAALRREQLNDQNIWPNLEEVETGQRPEWKDISDRSPTYKSCWDQSNSLFERNGIPERH